MEKPAMQAHRKSEESGNQAVFRVAREKPRPRRISPQAGSHGALMSIRPRTR
jgi:hypothetical protein